MTAREETKVDVTALWQQLLADQDVEDAIEVAEIMSEAPVDGLGAKLGGVTDLAFGAVLSDPSSAENLVPLLLPMAQRAVGDPDAIHVDGRGVVAATTLLSCLGVADPPADAPGEIAAPWVTAALAAVPTLLDEDRNDWALICLAHRLDDSVLGFTGGQLPDFAPGEAFGPDKSSFARYLVAAAAAGAGVEGVNAAWTSFVADFPAALETGSVRMSCLLHAGYAVYTRFGGHRPDQVLDAIREFVRAGMEG
jgi:hypothetical protein